MILRRNPNARILQFQLHDHSQPHHGIVNHGKCLHRIDVEEAHARQIGREAAREHRKLRFEKALDTALLVATIAGTAVVTAFFCGLAAC